MINGAAIENRVEGTNHAQQNGGRREKTKQNGGRLFVNPINDTRSEEQKKKEFARVDCQSADTRTTKKERTEAKNEKKNEIVSARHLSLTRLMTNVAALVGRTCERLVSVVVTVVVAVVVAVVVVVVVVVVVFVVAVRVVVVVVEKKTSEKENAAGNERHVGNEEAVVTEFYRVFFSLIPSWWWPNKGGGGFHGFGSGLGGGFYGPLARFWVSL